VEGEDIYFIGRGEAEVHIYDKKREKEYVRTLKPGACFGELCAVIPKVKRTATVKATNYCTTALLCKTDFDSLLELYPVIKEGLVKQILAYDDTWKFYITGLLRTIPYMKKLKHLELL
jgi:CRP-like cAMP-binding protein